MWRSMSFLINASRALSGSLDGGKKSERCFYLFRIESMFIITIAETAIINVGVVVDIKPS